MVVRQSAAAEAKSGIEFLTGEGDLGVGFVVDRLQDYAQVYVSHLFEFGALEARLDLVLPENALIDAFILEITARRASSTLARAAAQLRTNAPRGEGDLAVVVDFGTPRTVTSLSVPAGFKILQVRTWNGSAFASFAYSKAKSAATSSAVLTSEVRSERLEVEIAGTGSGTKLLDEMSLVLPDLPSDLDLRLEGDDVLFRHPGPAQASTASSPTFDGFNKDGIRLVDLTAAIQKRLGNPLSGADRTLNFLLTSRAPGFLKVETSDLRYRRIRRATLDGKEDITVDFEAEGVRSVQLDAAGLPAEALISEIRLDAVGAPPTQRRLPPVGPMRGNLNLLDIDPNHAVAVRLPSASGLALLTGLRFDLEAGAEGAELRVVLWDGELLDSPLPADQRPSRPISTRSDGASEPLALAGGASGWITITFAKAIELDPEMVLWAVLLVSRGKLRSWLGPGTGAIGRVMTGPPSGPFQKLPALFDQGAFAAERMPLRMIGEAPTEAPIAPLYLRRTTVLPVTPTAKGVRAVLLSPPDPSRSLEVGSLAVQTVQLRNVDIVSTA